MLYQLVADKTTSRVVAVPYQSNGGGFRIVKNKDQHFYFLAEVEGSESDVSTLEQECSRTLLWDVYVAPTGRYLVPSILATTAVVELMRVAQFGTVVVFSDHPKDDWVLAHRTHSYEEAVLVVNEALIAL